MTMPANPHPKSAGRALIWVLLALAAMLGVGIPIYRAASQNSAPACDQSPVPTNCVPPAILQLFQKQVGSPPWNNDAPAKTQAILQQCATLQQLITSGATDDALSNALAATTMRVSVFMTFGESLFQTGDTNHAQMFFTSVVNDHPTRATAKQLGRCYLWLGRIHQDAGLNWKYQQRAPDQAGPEYGAAITNYLAATNVSATNDWVQEVGWLQAAACYRELGDQESRRYCLGQLLAEPNATPAHRDLATYLQANSYCEQERWYEAAQVYQQMQQQLTGQPQQYQGQSMYLALINTGLSVCEARQTALAAGQVSP